MREDRNEFERLYRLDMRDEWMNSAYDEEGEAALCDICGEELKWDPAARRYECRSCGREMSRDTYFEYIGASPPGSECRTSCEANYPFCKKHCKRYAIDPSDPMLRD